MSEFRTPSEVYRALQRRARDERRGTQELFEFYLLERFLYRLSVSQYRDLFVLKGGLLLTVLGARRATPTYWPGASPVARRIYSPWWGRSRASTPTTACNSTPHPRGLL